MQQVHCPSIFPATPSPARRKRSSTEPPRNAGQLHPKAVLSDREVGLLRQLREVDGLSYGALARIFEIPKGSVRDFCKYRRR